MSRSLEHMSPLWIEWRDCYVYSLPNSRHAAETPERLMSSTKVTALLGRWYVRLWN